jgi:hypothetical protein
MNALQPSNEQIVAMDLLASGRATASEVAHLAGVSQQRVHRWIDDSAPPFWPQTRACWLADQWNADMAAIERGAWL